MKIALSLLFLGIIASISAQDSKAGFGNLIEVASFPDRQVTGIAVSKTGRIFVNFPDWSDSHTISVAEWKNGQLVPFPNWEWNTNGAPGAHFICVQSVYVDPDDMLWILDAASPKMMGVVQDGPKLVEVDLATNKVVRAIPFTDAIATKNSYLNDVRVDTEKQVAFITESGEGSIIVVDLRSGSTRRRFLRSQETTAESGFKLTVNGRKLIDKKTGKPPRINADGIALDPQRQYLYFHALCGNSLYRIPTGYLTSDELTDEEVQSRIDRVAETPPPDGMVAGSDGEIYLTDIRHGAILRFTPGSPKLETIVQDERLLWPDSMSWGPDGMLYVACSQIQNMPRFNNGKNIRTGPYQVFKCAVKH